MSDLALPLPPLEHPLPLRPLPLTLPLKLRSAFSYSSLRLVLTLIADFMPITSFASLPADARVWIFGAAAPVDDTDAVKLLAAVDAYLLQWQAHGHPLTAAREWRDERFLVVGVDQSTE